MLKGLLPVLAGIFYSVYSTTSFALTHSTAAVDDEQFSAVVHITSEAPDSTGESIPGHCNATFIAKNILVTAAHCIKFAYLSKDNLLKIEIGYYKYVTRPTGERVRIGYAPKYKFDRNVNIEIPATLADKFASRGEKTQIAPNEDFAILWWNEATPEVESITPITPVTNAEHAEIIKNIRAYSLSALSINLISEPGTDYKRMGALDNFKWSNGYVRSTSTVRVQEGDSGAPLFVKMHDQLKIFGVVKGKASTIFSNWDVYPAINTHLCILNKKMPMNMRIKTCL